MFSLKNKTALITGSVSCKPLGESGGVDRGSGFFVIGCQLVCERAGYFCGWGIGGGCLNFLPVIRLFF